MMSAGKTPANAGSGRGQELRGRLVVLLGSKGKLQDMVFHWFGAGWKYGGVGVACPWHGCLRARVSGMGEWGVSRGGRGVLGGCWTRRGQQGSKFGVPFEYRVGAPFCTICHYMALLGFKWLKENGGMQVCRCCGDRCW